MLLRNSNLWYCLQSGRNLSSCDDSLCRPSLRCSSWHFSCWEVFLPRWLMKVRLTLLMKTQQQWSWNVPVLLPAETSLAAWRTRSPPTRQSSLQTLQGWSRSGLLPILSHSWHFHMYDWGAFLTPNIFIEIYPNPGTLTRFQNWTQTQRSWSFICPSLTFSTAFLVFPSSLPPSTMVISRKWVIREQNHIMCLPLQGFSIFVQLLSSCSQLDLICGLPHNGCHRPHQLHRTHLWQKLLQTICSDTNHSCHLCRHMAACFCYHQPNHLWLWSFWPQFWPIWLGPWSRKMQCEAPKNCGTWLKTQRSCLRLRCDNSLPGDLRQVTKIYLNFKLGSLQM